MEQNIKVFCRIRPPPTTPNSPTRPDFNWPKCFDVSEDASEITVSTKNRVKMELQFKFDHIFGEQTSQSQLFDTIMAPVIEEVITGFNSTVFAYGQTGSGKTHSIIGCPSTEEQKLDDRVGLMPRAAKYLIEKLAQLHKSDQRQFQIECAFVEVYQEKLKDLLVTGNSHLEIKSHRNGSVHIKNLSYQTVISPDDIVRLMSVSRARRMTCATFMNTHSSRSHWLAMLRITQTFADATVQVSKLNFVDLAGSEKVSKSGATGHTLEEAKLINKSLLMLGQVINALATKAPHIPYRDSKLTHILKDSLGGNTKTTLLVTVSPLVSCQNETISTLRFGSRAQQIVTRASINRRVSRQELRRVIQNLEKQLSEIQANSRGQSLSPSRSTDLQSEVDELRGVVSKLEDSLAKKEKEVKSLRKEKKHLHDQAEQSEKLVQEMCAKNKLLSKRKSDLERRVSALTERVNLQNEHMTRALENRTASKEVRDGMRMFLGMQERSQQLFERVADSTETHERGLQQILCQQQEMFASMMSFQQEILYQISQQTVVLQTFHAQRSSGFLLGQSRHESVSSYTSSIPVHSETSRDTNDDEKREFLEEEDQQQQQATVLAVAVSPNNSCTLRSASSELVQDAIQSSHSGNDNLSDGGFQSLGSQSSSDLDRGSCASSNCAFSGASVSVPESIVESESASPSRGGQVVSSCSVSAASVVVYDKDGVVFSSEIICEDYFEEPDAEEISLSDMSRSLGLSMKPKKKFKWIMFARRRRARKVALGSQSPRPSGFLRKHAVDLSDSHFSPYQLMLQVPH